MIRSMTGYGRGIFENEGRNYKVEIKTVNHKYTDINLKMPRQISFLEDNIRKLIAKNISRGKIETFVTMENYSQRGRTVKIDECLAKMYVEQLQEIANKLNIEDDIKISNLTKLPEILAVKTSEDEELIWQELKQAVIEAINNLNITRQIEGERLKQDILQRRQNIQEAISIITEKSKTIVDEYKTKLEARIKDILNTTIVDENRLATEIVIYSDKCSIEEELTRLDSHLKELINILEKGSPCGKKLDFLIQEINRETNTIGSKANSLDITKQVVEIKTMLEDIREQIQNIE